MHVASRYSPTACPCGTAPNSRSMQRSSARSPELAPRGLARIPAPQPPCRTPPDANGAKPAQSSRARRALLPAPLGPTPCRRRRGTAASGCAAMRAYAASLLELPPAGEACVVGEAPELHEIRADVRGSLPLTISRLPAPTSHAA